MTKSLLSPAADRGDHRNADDDVRAMAVRELRLLENGRASGRGQGRRTAKQLWNTG